MVMAFCFTLELVNSGAWNLSFFDLTVSSEREIIKNAKLEYLHPAAGDFIYHLNSLAGEITMQLSRLENGLQDENASKYAAFLHLFSDGNLVRDFSKVKFLNIVYNRDQNNLNDARAAAAVLAIYRGIYLFLKDSDRYARLNARFCYLYSAWQWYNLIKGLAARFDNDQVISEMGEAYRNLTKLLEDPAYTPAARGLERWCRAKKDDPLLRDSLRLSMVLGRNNSKKDVWEVWSAPDQIIQPASAAGCFDDYPLEWSRALLHPVFCKRDEAKLAVSQLISEWSLPRYDFGTAIHLARLLKKNECSTRKLSHWHYFIISTLWFILVVALGTAAAPLMQTLFGLFDGILLTSFIEILLGFAFIRGVVVRMFDNELISYLVLPRLIGGICIGYLAFILDEGTRKIVDVFWSYHGLLIVLLWAAVIFAAYKYLKRDVSTLIADEKTAAKRACFALCLAVTISAVVGLFVVAVYTAAYYQGELLDWGRGCCVGPAGWVDYRIWVVFAPLALFIGIFTQFLFEERIVTESVWAPRKE